MVEGPYASLAASLQRMEADAGCRPKAILTVAASLGSV